jgi:hypothetical protein
MNENDRSLSVNIDVLLCQLRALIADTRKEAKRTVDVIQVRTCWEIGRHIVEFEQGGQARAAYGKKLLSRLAESLTGEFGKGFDATNLRHTRRFYLAFPICDTVRRELSWSYYRALLRVDNPEARLWYVNEAAAQNWSFRALDRQIGTLYYERLLLSSDKSGVEAEAEANIAALPRSPREFVRDPVRQPLFIGLAIRRRAAQGAGPGTHNAVGAGRGVSSGWGRP